MLEYSHVSYTINNKQILNDINFKLEPGKITTILGSNGSGKSSLIKLLLKDSKTYEGIINLDGNVFKKNANTSILMQSTNIPDHFTVYDFLKYSLIGSRSLLSKLTSSDQLLIDSALDKCSSLEFKDSYISDLSGGERQRILIAAALLNNPKLLILDEPTTFLDIKYQTLILKLIKELNEVHKVTILIVIHDINQGIKLADNVLMLKAGKLIINKPSDEVNEEDLNQAFDIEFNRHGQSTFVTM